RCVQLAVADVAEHEAASDVVGVGQRAVNSRDDGDGLPAVLAQFRRPRSNGVGRRGIAIRSPAVQSAGQCQGGSAGEELATRTTLVAVWHGEFSAAGGRDSVQRRRSDYVNTA